MEFNHVEEHIDEEMMKLEANIDDMNPELCEFVGEKLFELGANDVYWTTIMMKKGRPGLCLHVLAGREYLEVIKQEIFSQTTTIGLRYYPITCHRLGRAFVKVETEWGMVQIKIGSYQGIEVNAAPEYRDCEALARRHGLAVKHVYDAAKHAYHKLKEQPDA